MECANAKGLQTETGGFLIEVAQAEALAATGFVGWLMTTHWKGRGSFADVPTKGCGQR